MQRDEREMLAATCIQRFYRQWREKRDAGRTDVSLGESIDVDATTEIRTSDNVVTEEVIVATWKRKEDVGALSGSEKEAEATSARQQTVKSILQMLKHAEIQVCTNRKHVLWIRCLLKNAKTLTAAQTCDVFPRRTAIPVGRDARTIESTRFLRFFAGPASKQAECVVERFRKKIEELRTNVRERDAAFERLQQVAIFASIENDDGVS